MAIREITRDQLTNQQLIDTSFVHTDRGHEAVLTYKIGIMLDLNELPKDATLISRLLLSGNN